MNTSIDELLKLAIQEQGSDLHISVGHPPVLRIAGQLVPFIKHEVVTKENVYPLISEMLTDEQEKRLHDERSIDFSYSIDGKARFRVNIFFQRETVSAAFRLIPEKIRSIEELNLPSELHRFVNSNQGFVLLTGPSSHGKSTTLAAMIDEINRTRAEHIITIEDPIEYIFEDDKSLIDQREVGRDTMGFPQALRSTFRQDPDVIMVGEMRDPETISTAITAAETGHLVFATLHTNSAAQTVHRIVDTFPADQQSQVRAQLSGSLLGIVSQRLLPRLKGGLIPATEIMTMTPAISNLIRENKVHEIPLVIDTSSDHGMVSLDRALATLVKAKEITLENALAYSLNPTELRQLAR